MPHRARSAEPKRDDLRLTSGRAQTQDAELHINGLHGYLLDVMFPKPSEHSYKHPIPTLVDL